VFFKGKLLLFAFETQKHMLIIRRVLYTLGLVILLAACSTGRRQASGEMEQAVIGFYNLENLFDTIDSPDVIDEEFTPGSEKQWNADRYAAKLERMASIISQLGDTVDMPGPAIMGICEVENRQVLEDLVRNKYLSDFGYSFVHQNSPDERGIDVALLYRPGLFEVNDIKALPLYIYAQEDNERIYTRDQLLVSGLLLGEKVHVLVNHWPSRYGGEERSRPARKAAAELSRSIVDSLLAIDDKANLIIMGDMNDDPNNLSIQEVLRAVKKEEIKASDLYNPYASKHENGEGTLCYRGVWNMFDQIILSQSLLNGQQKLRFKDAYVYNSEQLKVQEGKYKGYPFRTYVGKRYDGGYSDHFPVFIVLNKY
jgi:endonuclease/exonuclease/phosphatase family metal-dependent hydrolase